MAVWLGHAGLPGPPGPTGPIGPMGPPNAASVRFPASVAPLFNGSSGNVSTPYNTPGGITALSVMAWLYIAGYPGGNPRFVANGHSDDGGGGFELWTNGGSGNVQATIATSSSAPTIAASGSYFDQWNLWGITWNGTTMALWLNAADVASASLSGTLKQAGHNLGLAYNSAYNGDYANCYLAHVAVFPGLALSGAQWARLYTASWNSPTAAAYEALVQSLNPAVYYPLQETSGTTATSLGTTGSADNGTYSSSVTLAATNAPFGLVSFATNPPAASTVALTSGTAWQNTTGADVWLYVPVTFSPTASAAASVALGVGPTATPSTSTVAAEPAGTVSGAVHTVTAYVPATFYAVLTTTNATLGTATVQPA